MTPFSLLMASADLGTDFSVLKIGVKTAQSIPPVPFISLPAGPALTMKRETG
jgi:hypothetical protein